MRLNSTVIHAANQASDQKVAVSYVNDGKIYQVQGQAAVMACYNRIIEYLLPELPQTQKAALSKCIKRPLMVVNVVLKNGEALAEIK